LFCCHYTHDWNSIFGTNVIILMGLFCICC
jgi:hypothetical protein